MEDSESFLLVVQRLESLLFDNLMIVLLLEGEEESDNLLLSPLLVCQKHLQKPPIWMANDIPMIDRLLVSSFRTRTQLTNSFVYRWAISRNRYSIDPNVEAWCCQWLLECHQAGIISPELTFVSVFKP